MIFLDCVMILLELLTIRSHVWMKNVIDAALSDPLFSLNQNLGFLGQEEYLGRSSQWEARVRTRVQMSGVWEHSDVILANELLSTHRCREGLSCEQNIQNPGGIMLKPHSFSFHFVKFTRSLVLVKPSPCLLPGDPGVDSKLHGRLQT